jgi:ribosomal protein L30/L7E|nr:hypothetical protein [Kofleriaceae bacterium]
MTTRRRARAVAWAVLEPWIDWLPGTQLVRNLVASRRLRRAFADAPRRTLAELGEDELACVTGRVRPVGPMLEAPLSRRVCAYYTVVVMEVSDGRRSQLASEQSGVAFALEHDGHRAIIDPAYARISAGFDHATRSRGAFDATPDQRSALDRLGLVRRDWFMTSSLEYREAILELDELIAVVGAAVREPDPDAEVSGLYREGGGTRLRLTGSARFPLLISDDPASISPPHARRRR